MNRRIPTYVVRRGNVFWFRMRIPAPLQPIAGAAEVSASLRTDSRREAQARAVIAERRLTLGLRTLRAHMDNETLQRLRGAIKAYLRALLRFDDDLRAGFDPTAEALHWTAWPPARYDSELAELRAHLENRTFNAPLVEIFADGAQAEAENLGFSLSGEAEGRVFRREMHTGLIGALEVMKARASFAPVAAIEDVARMHGLSEAAEQPAAAVSKPAGPLLSVAVAEFMGRYTDAAPATRRACGDALRWFQDHTGDKALAELGHDDVREFVAGLQALPVRHGLDPRFKGLSFAAAVKLAKTLADVTPRNLKTINGILGWVGTFLRWAESQGWPCADYTRGKELRERGRAAMETPRAVFEPADLVKVFGPEEYTRAAEYGSGHWRFWLPLLALFTGARLGELAQLGWADVRYADGVWLIDLNTDGGKTLKTRAARRLVPLHDFLVRDLNLPGYALYQRKHREKRLFPELKSVKDHRPGHYAGRWFADYLGRLGMGGRGLSFHSFRHGFITNAKRAGADIQALKEVVGHARKDLTLDLYGRGLEPAALKALVIDKLDFGVDLGHLAKARAVQMLPRVKAAEE